MTTELAHNPPIRLNTLKLGQEAVPLNFLVLLSVRTAARTLGL